MKKIVIFASGSGTNAENIIRYFDSSKLAKVVKVFTNKADAQVIQRAKNFNIGTEIFSKNDLETGKVLQEINTIQPDLIVLAGFLLKFPETIVAAYPDKIINIHPALLPKYGGKGMYGMHVHRAVVENKEKETSKQYHLRILITKHPHTHDQETADFLCSDWIISLPAHHNYEQGSLWEVFGPAPEPSFQTQPSSEI